MPTGRYRFEDFELDLADRRLIRGGAPVALNARYLDALAVLAAEPGHLISKDRFMAEVWRGMPVTDEALTQCIRVLRRQLGDDAASPRFIETVPKHGYRFIAAVEVIDGRPDASSSSALNRTLAGTFGGGAAGAVGGLLYGLIGASQASAGQVSTLLVMITVTTLVGLAGGGAVSLGMAIAGPGPARPVLGAALGGLAIGAAARLIGLDAFTVLLGQSPGAITGPFEGLILGAAAGLAVQLAAPPRRPRPAMSLAAASGGFAGLLIALMGGRLMGGSLDALAGQFPASRLTLAPLAALLGEPTFGMRSAAVTATLEGLLFTLGVAAAMRWVRPPSP